MLDDPSSLRVKVRSKSCHTEDVVFFLFGCEEESPDGSSLLVVRWLDKSCTSITSTMDTSSRSTLDLRVKRFL